MKFYSDNNRWSGKNSFRYSKGRIEQGFWKEFNSAWLLNKHGNGRMFSQSSAGSQIGVRSLRKMTRGKNIFGSFSLISALATYGWMQSHNVHAQEQTSFDTLPSSSSQPSQSQIKKLKRIFRKYATKGEDGKFYMTPENFVKSIVGRDRDLPDGENQDNEQIRMLFRVADRDNNGYLDFNEYKLLFKFLTTPESEFELAFRYFDQDRTGQVTRDDFQKILERNWKNTKLGKFDFNCDLIKQFFGHDSNVNLSYTQFSQFMRQLNEEIRRQEFNALDKRKDGTISAQNFAKLITGYVSDQNVPSRLVKNIQQLGESNERIRYVDFITFNKIIGQMPMIAMTLRAASQKTKDGSISKEDFARATLRATGMRMSPMETNIVFKLFSSSDNAEILLKSDYEDFLDVVSSHSDKRTKLLDLWVDDRASEEGTEMDWWGRTLQNFKKFALKVGYGGFAGGVGATVVYPIDLVKTRMQNQRSGEMFYKNSFDCFKQVFQKEGFLGFYRGLGPQLIGVAPEKAIKLVTNDILREFFGDTGEAGSVSLPLEIIAGCGGGASQVVFTNPIEITKIRMQISGESARRLGTKPKSFMTILNELGFRGLYKGSSACFARDIPFSGIYFPLYAYLKETFKREDQEVSSAGQILAAGSLAGFVAAGSTTPFDVIKTRLQVETREGQRVYNGLYDTAVHIYKEEGARAFFKGFLPRVTRSSPQFGVTLLTYSFVQRFFANGNEAAKEEGRDVATTVRVEEDEIEDLRELYQDRLNSFSKIFGK